MAKKIFITGLPKVGKTTLIKKLVGRFAHAKPCGFYTEEILEDGQRVGFRLVSIGGVKSEYLAHINFQSSLRVGKYGVNLSGFESFLKALDFSKSSLIFIDEIGKMECYSDFFASLIMDLLSSEKIIVATVSLYGSGLIDEVKKMPGASIYHLNKGNREETFLKIAFEIETELQKNK